jgi:hypothetical protein
MRLETAIVIISNRWPHELISDSIQRPDFVWSPRCPLRTHINSARLIPLLILKHLPTLERCVVTCESNNNKTHVKKNCPRTQNSWSILKITTNIIGGRWYKEGGKGPTIWPFNEKKKKTSLFRYMIKYSCKLEHLWREWRYETRFGFPNHLALIPSSTFHVLNTGAELRKKCPFKARLPYHLSYYLITRPRKYTWRRNMSREGPLVAFGRQHLLRKGLLAAKIPDREASSNLVWVALLHFDA